MIPTAPTLEKLRAKGRIREGLDFRGCGKTSASTGLREGTASEAAEKPMNVGTAVEERPFRAA